MTIAKIIALTGALAGAGFHGALFTYYLQHDFSWLFFPIPITGWLGFTVIFCSVLYNVATAERQPAEDVAK